MNHYHCDSGKHLVNEEHYKDGYCLRCSEEKDKINSMSSSESINKIEKIRSRNNKNWMDILRLAFQYAPDEAKKIMANITKCDMEITRLSKKLAEE